VSDIQIEGFRLAFKGSFLAMRSWDHLDDLWSVIRLHAEDDWYIYAVGEQPPAEVSNPEQLHIFIDEVDIILRRDHGEEYCGIVYVDDPLQPTFVKIFDPNNLGVSCGFSDNPPLPGWVMSKLMPVDLHAAVALPGNRRRWWNRLFG